MLFVLYRIVVFVLYALAFPVLGLLALAGSVKWRNRLGRGFGISFAAQGKLIWAHAASVGEARALAHFVRVYCRRNSDTRVVVTVVTDSGYQTASADLDDLLRSGIVAVRYLPLDCPQSIRKALKSIRPDIVIFTETEIWPNWTAALRAREIPYVLLNARLTERSLKGYLKAHSFVASTMANYEMIMCQSSEHAERFAALGAPMARICVSGNIKNDAPINLVSSERQEAVRTSLGVAQEDFLVVCGSIRTGEFVGALEVYQRLSVQYPQLRFVLAPRHLERCAEIQNEAERLGIAVEIFNGETGIDCSGTNAVIIVDVFGALQELYGAADLAFVGGTMVPIGGHNILEPPQVGTPVVFGPHTANVTEGVALVVQRNCGLQVADWNDFEAQVERVVLGKVTFGKWNDESHDSIQGGAVSPMLYSIEKIEGILGHGL